MVLSLKKCLALCSLTVIILLSACSKNNNAAPNDPYGNPPGTPPASSSLALGTSTAFGSILTDANGKSLYFFAIDANGTSGCTGACAITWMPYYAGNETAPTGITATDITTITRADGNKQTVYKGWPLYYFSGDVYKTDINGDGSGGTWFVAKPDYSIMLSNSQLVGIDGKNYTGDLKEGTGITQYLTDAAGRTLYAFAPDKFNLNTYTEADLSNNSIWPIYESDVLNVPSVLKKDMMAQITSAGKKQLTYKGHPLYYFGSDAKRGDNKGVSVGAGLWPVLTVNTTPLTP